MWLVQAFAIGHSQRGLYAEAAERLGTTPQALINGSVSVGVVGAVFFLLSGRHGLDIARAKRLQFLGASTSLASEALLLGFAHLSFQRAAAFDLALLIVLAISPLGWTALLALIALSFSLLVGAASVAGPAFGSEQILFLTHPLAMALLAIVVNRWYLGIFKAEWLTRTRLLRRTRQLEQHKRHIERLAQELGEANMAKTYFLAAASHDLRQPMHALGLFIGALRAYVTAPAGLAIMQQAERSVDALEKLFNTILDISKLDAQVVAPRVREVPVANVFATVALLYTPEAAAKGLALRVHHTDVVARTDPDLLDRALRNLVSNAIRYTERGGILLGVRRRRPGVAEIVVCDTGIGIPDDQQEEIFKEFVQLGNPTHDRSKGLGLGLSIVDRIAKLLGHAITVRSRMNRGSCFGLAVPCVATPAVPESITATPRAVNDRLGGAFIVVVDDEETILAGTEALLMARGCHCVCGTSSQALLEKLAEHSRQPDLVITDFRIGPRETALDVIRAIRANQQSDIPALIVTGSQSAADLKAASASGFRVIYKPVLERELIAVINELLVATGSVQPAFD